MSDSMIEARGLVKAYRAVRVLGGVDLAVERGSVFALLGPNGAGKTTIVRVLSTLTRADAGQARVAGFDVARERSQVRRRISLTGQFAAVDDAQTGTENLVMMARLTGLSHRDARRRAAQVLERFDLSEAGRRRVGTYSGGMRRRLDLAAGLVGRPEVIFLDEPTTGLDPRSRLEAWSLITDLAGGGTTVFLTTQYLDEADRLADRIAVLDGGMIVAEGTAAELKSRIAEQRLELVLAGRGAFDRALLALGPRAVRSDAQRLTVAVAVDGSAARVRSVLDEIDPGRQDVATFALRGAALDDVFLALTGDLAAGTDHPTGTQLEANRV